MRHLRWPLTLFTIMVVPMTVSTASALTCTRLWDSMVSCSDGTVITDPWPGTRTITGPGATRGIEKYPIPPQREQGVIQTEEQLRGAMILHERIRQERAATQAPSPTPSAPPSWWQPLPPRSPNGVCAKLYGRTICD